CTCTSRAAERATPTSMRAWCAPSIARAARWRASSSPRCRRRPPRTSVASCRCCCRAAAIAES
ncbi:MAG: hypothetical protein ACK56F_24635, partial [bacterium]